MKHFFTIFLSIVLFACFATSVWAATLTLTKIGTSSTTTLVDGGSWTYSSANPIFTGTADALATVNLEVDSANFTATADSTGAWTWTPTTLTAGIHQISITSGVEEMNFTLTIGSASSTSMATSSSTASATLGKGGVGAEATTSTTKGGELLQTGSFEQTMIMIAGGLLLLGIGLVRQSKVTAEL